MSGNTFKKILKVIRASVIAALYVSLCLVFAPISFGPVQIRISEALTLLAVLCPEAIAGVTVGCFLANMIASAPIDMVFGSLATLAAGIGTYRLRAYRTKGFAIVPSLPPIIINAVVVGAVLTLLYFPSGSPLAVWLMNMASVGAGQVVSCGVLGVLLVYLIEKNKKLLELITK